MLCFFSLSQKKSRRDYKNALELIACALYFMRKHVRYDERR